MWAKAFSGTGTDRAYGLATTVDGSVVFGGSYGGLAGQTLSFQGKPNLSCAGGVDAVGAVLNQDGLPVALLKLFGAPDEPNNQIIRAIAVDPQDGSIIVAGEFEGHLDGPPSMLASAGVKDVFVAKFAKDWTPTWAHALGSSGEDLLGGIALDSLGDVLVAGSYTGSLFTFGTKTATDHGGATSSDVFVGKFGPGGDTLWLNTCGGALPSSAYGLAVDSMAGVTVSGAFAGNIQCDSATPGMATASIGTDGLLVHYAADGKSGWVKGIVAKNLTGDRRARAIAADGSGRLYVAGDFSGGIDFGGNAGSFLDQGGSAKDMFLASYQAADGTPQWAKAYPDVNPADSPQGQIFLAAGLSGELVLAGAYSGTLNFGGKAVAAQATDAFVVRIDASQKFLWQYVLDGGGNQAARAVRFVGPEADVMVTGDFEGTVDLDGTSVAASGASDVFVTKLQH